MMRLMPGELRNRTVVITGASAGVGRATAHRFARAGARIAVIARDEDALNDVKNEIEGLGGTGFVAPADVADADQVFAAADSIPQRFGPIDIWINDAMVTVFSPVWDMTPAEFRRVTEVTYLGMVHGTMAAAGKSFLLSCHLSAKKWETDRGEFVSKLPARGTNLIE
jgi:NAD(P)-dependent dehydrogenase (short-subunit alcohol dehydrogenase family)